MIPSILLLQVLWGILSHIPKKELRKLFKLTISFTALSFLFGLLSLPVIINTFRVYFTYRGAIPYYVFRPESLHDFSYWLNVPVLLLSILGIIVFLGTKSRKSKSLIFLLIWFLFTLFLTQAPTFGIGMPGRRFLTYFSLPVSIFSALGLCHIISKFRRGMTSVARFVSNKRELVHRVLIRTVLPLLLVSSIATYSYFSAYLFPGFLPWQPEDVEAAKRLRDLALSRPGAVITYDLRLIQFCNVSNYEPDFFIVSQILDVSSYTELMNFLKSQYDGRFSRVYFFISFATRKSIEENAPDFNLHLARMEMIYGNQRSEIYEVDLL
jgi:hypothetical protein